MTAPLNGELAWDISEWNNDIHNSDETVLKRSEIESLARFLTAKGYARPKTVIGEMGLGELYEFAEKARVTAQQFLKGPRAATNPAG